MTFRELAVGQSFDWIGPDRIMNSFFLRCTKISMFRYRDERGVVHRVGTTKAQVFNAED